MCNFLFFFYFNSIEWLFNSLLHLRTDDIWANILKYTDPTRFSGPPWRADKQDKAQWHFQGKTKTATVFTSGNNCPFFFCKHHIQWAAFLAGYSNQWLMLVFQAPCSAGWSIQTYLAYITEVSKPSNCLSTLVSFPTRHDRFLKDHLNMLNFPFFVKVFGTLWAINWEKTAHCSMFFPPTENLYLKRYFFKKEKLFNMSPWPTQKLL